MTRADWLVTLSAAAGVAFLYLWMWIPAGAGQQAAVWVNGEMQTVVALDEPRHLSVHGVLGDSLLEIHDHRVRFVSSPCRNKVCIHGGWITHAGETLACLPNRVSVHILGRERRYDTVNF